MRLLGLDVGTTGCKAVVFDVDGRPLGMAFREYEVLCQTPGMAEQDPERVWELSLECLREALTRAEVREVVAMSVSVQGDAVILVDAAFRPISPAVLGMDYRSEPQARWCAERWGDYGLFERTGMRPHPIVSLAKILWLKSERASVYERARSIVTYADYVLGRLGAEGVIDESMASRTMACGLAACDWDAALLAEAGVARERLSRPVASGTVVGRMLLEVAEAVGLRGRPLLVAGGHDQPCAALGAGMVRPGLGVVSTGTAEVFSSALSAPVLTRGMYEGYYPCYRHVVPGQYFTFALNHVGGILLKWFRDEMCHADVEAARSAGESTYARLDRLMPRGVSPVMVLPHWNGSGTPWCDLEARGAMVGLSIATTRYDVAKAILEGLTFELRINVETMAQLGIPVERVVAVGGGARSEVWLQLKADVLGRPVRTLVHPESACLGAALLAGVGAKVYATLEEAVGQTVRYGREYVPEGRAQDAYEARYTSYRRLYPALRGLR